MSGELSLSQVTANQANKEATLNGIAAQLEGAIASQLAVDLSNNVSVTQTQLQLNGQLIVTAAVVGKVLMLPATKRLIAVNNTTAQAIAVAVGTTSVSLAATTLALFLLDGTPNGLAIMSAGGSGGSSTALSALTDVDMTTPPTDGQVLAYSGARKKWYPATLTGGSVGPGGTAPVAKRYWRVTFNTSPVGTGHAYSDMGLAELFLATAAGGLTPAYDYNGASVSTMTNIFDNNKSSVYENNVNGDQYIKLDFRQPTSFVEARMSVLPNKSNEAPNYVLIESSSDDVTYTTVKSLTFNFPNDTSTQADQTLSLLS